MPAEFKSKSDACEVGAGTCCRGAVPAARRQVARTCGGPVGRRTPPVRASAVGDCGHDCCRRIVLYRAGPEVRRVAAAGTALGPPPTRKVISGEWKRVRRAVGSLALCPSRNARGVHARDPGADAVDAGRANHRAFLFAVRGARLCAGFPPASPAKQLVQRFQRLFFVAALFRRRARFQDLDAVSEAFVESVQVEFAETAGHRLGHGLAAGIR